MNRTKLTSRSQEPTLFQSISRRKTNLEDTRTWLTRALRGQSTLTNSIKHTACHLRIKRATRRNATSSHALMLWRSASAFGQDQWTRLLGPLGSNVGIRSPGCNFQAFHGTDADFRPRPAHKEERFIWPDPPHDFITQTLAVGRADTE